MFAFFFFLYFNYKMERNFPVYPQGERKHVTGFDQSICLKQDMTGVMWGPRSLFWQRKLKGAKCLAVLNSIFITTATLLSRTTKELPSVCHRCGGACL